MNIDRGTCLEKFEKRFEREKSIFRKALKFDNIL